MNSRVLFRSKPVVYFGQGVGGVFSLSRCKSNPLPILYSDAATSCLICFCCGQVSDDWSICYAHIDSVDGVREYFKKVTQTFALATSRVELYAAGAVDFALPSTKNYGKEMNEEFTKILKDYNLSETQEDGKIWIRFNTPELVFQHRDKFSHYLGYDVQEKELITDHIPLSKVENYLEFGMQCALFTLKREHIYWMDHSFSVDHSKLDFGYIPYYASRSMERNEIRKLSTTPELEPEEYYDNSLAFTLFAQYLMNFLKNKNLEY